MENHARPRDLLPEDFRNSAAQDEQEAEVRVGHHVLVFQAAEVRRCRQRRLPRGYVVSIKPSTTFN